MPEIKTCDEAVELLSQVVEEYGRDHVYVSPRGGPYCFYVHDGQPSCLIGHVLMRAGFALDLIAELDHSFEMPNATAFSLVADLIHQRSGFEGVTEHVCGVLGQAQTLQDLGYTWGKILDEVKRWCLLLQP